MKDLLIAKKQELETKKAEILNVNVDELISEKLADYEAELRRDYAKMQKTEIDNIDMKLSVIDELIAECEVTTCECTPDVEVVDAPVESVPVDTVDTVDTYEVADEA